MCASAQHRGYRKFYSHRVWVGVSSGLIRLTPECSCRFRRDIAVVKAAAERAPATAPRPHRRHVERASHLGYARGSGAVVAIVGEVEIDRCTGKAWARKFTVAHDCGLMIDPDGLRSCIEGNVVHGTSRALSEEVAFDRARVTRTDWLSYPILDITEALEAVDIVLINRPELPPAGAGESSIRPVAAALVNAVSDATGRAFVAPR